MEEELRKLHQQERYLQMLQQSLARNMSLGGPRRASVPQGASSWTAEQTVSAARRSGLSRQGEEEFMPRHEDCTPRCNYKCTNPTCEEECTPQCESPKCQTRCTGTELSGCRMQCGQPHCSVVCPSKMCSGPNCQPCTTKCSEPMCMLQCPKAQPCHNVCEQPQCQWKCKAPTTCAKPKCDLVCESPSACMGSTFKELPPLKSGEMSVLSFAAPADLVGVGEGQSATQTRSSFLELGANPALRGSAPEHSHTSSLLRVPVESVSAEAGVLDQVPWHSRRAWQPAASPQSQQWTARMPVAVARTARGSFAAQPSQGYYTHDAAALEDATLASWAA